MVDIYPSSSSGIVNLKINGTDSGIVYMAFSIVVKIESTDLIEFHTFYISGNYKQENIPASTKM